MVTKVRKQIYIEPYQEVILKRMADQSGRSEAEIIRQAIDHHARSLHLPQQNVNAWIAEREFITGLIAKGPVSGGRTWKREELHER